MNCRMVVGGQVCPNDIPAFLPCHDFENYHICPKDFRTYNLPHWLLSTYDVDRPPMPALLIHYQYLVARSVACVDTLGKSSYPVGCQSWHCLAVVLAALPPPPLPTLTWCSVMWFESCTRSISPPTPFWLNSLVESQFGCMCLILVCNTLCYTWSTPLPNPTPFKFLHPDPWQLGFYRPSDAPFDFLLCDGLPQWKFPAPVCRSSLRPPPPLPSPQCKSDVYWSRQVSLGIST